MSTVRKDLEKAQERLIQAGKITARMLTETSETYKAQRAAVQDTTESGARLGVLHDLIQAQGSALSNVRFALRGLDAQESPEPEWKADCPSCKGEGTLRAKWSGIGCTVCGWSDCV